MINFCKGRKGLIYVNKLESIDEIQTPALNFLQDQQFVIVSVLKCSTVSSALRSNRTQR